MIDDELILRCKHWKVEMRFAPPKEKPDAAASRQAIVRSELERAEKSYYAEMAETTNTMKDWFFDRMPEHLL